MKIDDGDDVNLNKKGFITLELVMYGAFMFALMAVIIGMFSYIYPAFELQREVHLLGKIAQQNGGLRNSDINDFEERVNDIAFVRDSGKEVKAEAYTSPSNYKAIGVSDSSFIRKGSGEIINIVIQIPTNNFIKKFTTKSSDYYTFKTSVMSEKY